MDGKIFIHVNDLINNIANSLGIKIPAIEVANIIDVIVKKYSNEDILNGKADEEIKNYIANKYNFTITNHVKEGLEAIKTDKTNDNDIFSGIKIVNEHQQENLETERYIRNYVQNMGLTEADISWIIGQMKSSYNNSEIINDPSLEEINQLLEFINLKNNSVTKDEEKRNEIIAKEKKPKLKKDAIKKILTFIVAGSMFLSLLSSYRKHQEKKEFINNVESTIETIINQNDEPLSEIAALAVDSENPNIITKNATPVYSNGEIYTDYNTKGIVEDIKDVTNINSDTLDSMIIYTFSHMQVDINTKIKVMNQVFKELGLNEDFVSYMLRNVEIDNKEDIIEQIRNGNRDVLNKLAHEFLKTKYNVYLEDYDNIQEIGDNINGPSKH